MSLFPQIQQRKQVRGGYYTDPKPRSKGLQNKSFIQNYENEFTEKLSQTDSKNQSKYSNKNKPFAQQNIKRNLINVIPKQNNTKPSENNTKYITPQKSKSKDPSIFHTPIMGYSEWDRRHFVIEEEYKKYAKKYMKRVSRSSSPQFEKMYFFKNINSLKKGVCI